MAEVRAARLRLYTTAVAIERVRHFDDYALVEQPIDIGILVDLEAALLSASWGAGTDRERLKSPSPLSSVANPPRLELQAKLIAAVETLPPARWPEVYAAVDRAGYPKPAARKYVDNNRHQAAGAAGGRARGNDQAIAREDHWKATLADLIPHGLDLDTYFQAL